MAKPIRATPELRDAEAKKFVKAMERRERERITQEDYCLVEAIETITPLV